MNGWFQDLVTSAAKPIFGLLHATAMGTPEIDSAEMVRARQLWATSQTIANTCYVLLITLGGMLLMAGHTLPGSELTPGQLLVRLVVAFLASNLSLTLIGYGISVANGLAGAFLSSGHKNIDAGVVADLISGLVVASLLPTQPFIALVGLGVVVLALCVAFIYIVRVAITMVLIAAAPIALMFHALPVTDGIARLWWRSLTGILAIQVLQSLVLVTAVQLLFTKAGNGHKDSQQAADGAAEVLGLPTHNDLVDLLLALALLWVLIRIPAWVARTIWQPAQPRMLGRLLQTFLVYRGIGALASRTGAAAMRGLTPSTPRRPPPPRPPDPPQPPAPPPTPPPAPPTPSDDDASTPGGPAVQLALPIPTPHKPAPKPKSGPKRPVQLALPIPATRSPRSAATGASPPPAPARRPRPRSGQLMLPAMPKRPVPHRQLPLWIEPPKTRRSP